MTDETRGDDMGGEDEAGWAAPGLPPKTPASEPAPSPAPAAGPDDPGAVPTAPSPAAPPAATAAAEAGVAGWSPTPQVAPGATPPRKRRGWIVVLVLALVSIVVLAIAGTFLFVDRTLPPYQGAYDFLSDYTKGDTRAATDRLCTADRRDPRAASGVLRDWIPVGSEVTVNFLAVDRSGDRAEVEFSVDPAGSSTRSRSHQLPMRLENGDWKACPAEGLR